MVDLLFPSDIFEKSVYTVGARETILDIALKTGVPPHFIIADNRLSAPPEKGDMLIIKKRGKTKILELCDFENASEEERRRIMELNRLDYLFVGEMVLI